MEDSNLDSERHLNTKKVFEKDTYFDFGSEYVFIVTHIRGSLAKRFQKEKKWFQQEVSLLDLKEDKKDLVLKKIRSLHFEISELIKNEYMIRFFNRNRLGSDSKKEAERLFNKLKEEIKLQLQDPYINIHFQRSVVINYLTDTFYYNRIFLGKRWSFIDKNKIVEVDLNTEEGDKFMYEYFEYREDNENILRPNLGKVVLLMTHYVTLIEHYNDFIDYEHLYTIETGEDFNHNINRQVMILNELGVLENIKNYLDTDEHRVIAKEVSKILGLRPNQTQTAVNSIMYNKKSDKNPYNVKQSKAKEFIKKLKDLFEMI